MDPSEIRILSAGSALPGPPIDNATLGRRFEMDDLWQQWVDVFIGTRSRHLAIDLDNGEIRYSLAELGEAAARSALEGAELQPQDVDVMVLATATPDHLMPATVNLVADRLGINGLPTYQLQSGCSGAVGALDVGRQMLLSGQHETALVIGGDVCAKHFDLSIDLRTLPPSELVNVVLFGDGAGAAVLSTEPRPGSTALRHLFTRLVGQDRPPGQIVEWFGMADRHGTATAVHEDYKAIEEQVPLMASEVLKELLDFLGWVGDDLDYILPPQLSGRMTARIMQQFALTDVSEVTCVDETGNNGNALPFLQMERLLRRMVTGDRAIGVAIESSKWIKSGFALERL